MSKKHVHYDIIMQWASDPSKTLQYRYQDDPWRTCITSHIPWDEEIQYRIKPEPKPDVVLTGEIRLGSGKYLEFSNIKDFPITPNASFIFDGETHKLKDIKVIQ